MKLPNGQRAIVDIAKLRNYCLSFDHFRGQHKARVFAAALGLTTHHAEELREALLEAARTNEATATNEDEYGQRYIVDLIMQGPRGKARVRSSWIVRNGEDVPRLITCYVL